MAKYKGFNGMDEYLDALDTCMRKAPGRCLDELRREGRQVVRTYRSHVKASAKDSSGRLAKGMTFNKNDVVKAGDSYEAYIKNDSRKAPHYHLVEKGHRMVSHSGESIGTVKGKHWFEESIKKEEPKLQAKRERMIEKLFRELE